MYEENSYDTDIRIFVKPRARRIADTQWVIYEANREFERVIYFQMVTFLVAINYR